MVSAGGIVEKIKVPTSLEAEARVLGGSMRSAEWASKLCEHLSELHFFDDRNRQIFSAIKDLITKDRIVNSETVFELIKLKNVSSEHFMNVLSLGSTGFFIDDFIIEIVESYNKRKLQAFAKSLMESVGTSSDNFETMVRKAEAELFSLTDEKAKTTIRSIPDILNNPEDVMLILQKKQDLRAQGISTFEGMPTHYYDLDRCISGLIRGHFTLIGARPGVGKTTFALNLMQNIISKSKAKVLFFSLEMPSKEICEKLVCQAAEFSHRKFREADVKDAFQRLYESKKFWDRFENFFIDDQPSLGIDQLKSRALRLKRTHGLDAIFIDYIQLVTSKKNTEARHLEIGDISRRCKEIAKELDVSIIALAQLNREIEKRTDKTPFVSDLRESGSLEADADEIILLHRPDMLNPKDKPGLMEVHLAKNRFGPQDKFDLVFDKENGVLKNYEKHNFKPQYD